MKIKVCGLKFPENIREIDRLKIGYLGFIFYEKSPRFIERSMYPEIANIVTSADKAGVFVNEGYEQIIEIMKSCKLNLVQLHGEEPVELCIRLQKDGYKVCKVFSIADKYDFEECKAYEPYCEFFLFDTKCPEVGGCGMQFDWSLLEYYKGECPFMLSGGISPQSSEMLKSITHPQFTGIDLNSRFESSYALKDLTLLKKFLSKICI